MVPTPDSPSEGLRDRFWEEQPLRVPDLRLIQVDTHVVPQAGRGGHRIYESVDLVLGSRTVRLLATYKQKLLAGEALNLRKRLLSVADDLRLRGLGASVPALVTDVAAPATIDVCLRTGTALFDLTGTAIVRTEGVHLHVAGTRPAKPLSRTPIFSGKGSRVVRRLLNQPDRRPTIRQLADEVRTAYSYVHGVVERLESEGFIEYGGRAKGVALRDPRGLLSALRDRGERPAAALESFNVRATNPASLRTASEVLERERVHYAFTLASGLEERDRFVTALPHGLFCSAGTELLTRAFGLRRQSPANFVVLRPRPAADSEAGGVYDSLRMLPWGKAVALPELIVDLTHAGGRGQDQSDHLLDAWVKSLPLLES